MAQYWRTELNINHNITTIMENERKRATSESDRLPKEDKKKQEEEIDEELDQTFPASDPPSYSSPGNDKDAD